MDKGIGGSQLRQKGSNRVAEVAEQQSSPKLPFSVDSLKGKITLGPWRRNKAAR
jgi:hypothetical protein